MEEGRQRQMESSCIKEKKVGYDFTTASKTEEGSITVKETATKLDDKSIPTGSVHPTDHMMSFAPTDAQNSSKPSLSYIALIAKVILSSPSQKLNLGSIYKVMEEQFPHLRSRGPGWRNSVRHNLSVNDCFVKVSRCEDGRGHYWGVHQAHLRDFQHGNFRQYRNSRGRRGRERNESMAGCLACLETSCLLGRFAGKRSRSLPWVEAQCPLQDPRGKQSSWDCIQPHYQPWSINLGQLQPHKWTTRYCCPEGLPDSHHKVADGRRCNSQHLMWRHHWWEINYPPVMSPHQVMKDVTESYDTRFMMASVKPFRFPCYWCMCPSINDIIHPLAYKIRF